MIFVDYILLIEFLLLDEVYLDLIDYLGGCMVICIV